MQIVIFTIDGRRYALNLNVVERSLLAVECTPIPNCSEYVLGAINVHGEIVPVVNMRKLLGIEPKEISDKDNMILCRLRKERIALLVDRVEKVDSCEEVVEDSHVLHCVLKEGEEMTMLCDLQRLIPENSLSMG